jgi:hypothetical protein
MLVPNKLSITYSAVMPNGKRLSEVTESNAVITEILSYSVTKTINSDKTSVREGETVHNNVTFTNKSAAKLFNNFFKISESDGATYVEGSIKVNGVSQPTFNHINGFTMPDLTPEQTVIIEYELKANNKITATSVTHFATLDYSVYDPARGEVNYSENTENVSFNVISDKNMAQTILLTTYGRNTIFYYNSARFCDYCCPCYKCCDDCDCCNDCNC